MYIYIYIYNRSIHTYIYIYIYTHTHAHREEQFKMVHPENYDRFPSHFALSTILLYSPRCLKRIINFCKGKDAYIIPGE